MARRPPAAGAVVVSGATSNRHEGSCNTTTCVVFTSSVPRRGATSGFEATRYVTDPSPWPVEPRSEERRVGKGGRARWWRYQAEDGIRDTSVTGVQTCALPI